MLLRLARSFASTNFFLAHYVSSPIDSPVRMGGSGSQRTQCMQEIDECVVVCMMLSSIFWYAWKFLRRPVIHTTTLSPSLTIIDLFVEYLSVFPWQQTNKTMLTPPRLALARLRTTLVHVILVLLTLLPNVLIHRQVRTQWAVECGSDID